MKQAAIGSSLSNFSRALHALDSCYPELRRMCQSAPVDPERARQLASTVAQRAQVLIEASTLLAHDAELDIQSKGETA